MKWECIHLFLHPHSNIRSGGQLELSREKTLLSLLSKVLCLLLPAEIITIPTVVTGTFQLLQSVHFSNKCIYIQQFSGMGLISHYSFVFLLHIPGQKQNTKQTTTKKQIQK